MSELKDKDLREALRRREARRTKPEVPADFMANVMQEIAPKPARKARYAYIAALAAAACIAVAVLMVWPTEDKQKSDGGALTAQRERIPSPSPTESQPDTVVLSSIVPKQVAQVRAKKQVPQQVQTKISDVDSLDYYINKIERELASVDDSLYIERIHRVMHADERLQRIVNNYIVNELHKDGKSSEANNINNVKTDEDEE